MPNEPWLGSVPEHWGTVKLKHVLAERNERGYPAEPLLAATQTKGVVLKSDYGTRTVEAMKDLHLLKLVRVGDFVISLRSFQGGIEHARHQGIISPAYTILHPRDSATHGYLAALFKSRPFIGNLTLYVTGIRQGQNIDYTKLARSYIPLPPPSEQSGIVRFLGAVDRKVNRFIRAKRRLIEVLTEQKQAIITHAVTKGLNPSAPLKPSGIDWLGDVPEHWEVDRIRTCLLDTRAGIWGDDPTPANVADHVTCLRVADFDMPHLGISSAKLTQRAVVASARTPRLLGIGDILMEKSGGGEAEPVGRVVLYDETVAPHAISSNFIVRLRPNRARVEPRFLLSVLAMMQATRRNVPWIKQTTGIQNLDERAYLSLAIGVPPLTEQHAIVKSVADMLKPVELAMSQARREIDLIREYRTRLVADVVTGKVDVRAAAAALPDEPPAAGTAGDEDAPADIDGPGAEADGDDPAEHTPEEVEA
jgi:type I restriction enzyme S subunit